MNVPNEVPAWLMGLTGLGLTAYLAPEVSAIEERLRPERLAQVLLALRAGLVMQAVGAILYIAGAPRVFAHATFGLGTLSFVWGLYRAGDLEPRRR